MPGPLWTSKCLHCLGINREKFPRQTWGSWFPGKPCWDSSASPPWTRGRRTPFITRKHMKAALIPRMLRGISGISVSTQNVGSFPEFPCVEFLDLGRENCCSCVCSHPGSASASRGRRQKYWGSSVPIPAVSGWIWGMDEPVGHKTPSRMGCEPGRGAGSVQTLEFGHPLVQV